jgi:F420-non-reducing hydrogenase iron-sulfur subunit
MKNTSIIISLFYCSNAISPEDINLINKGLDDVKIKSISLPCSGKVSLLYLLKAIETDSDGLILVTCKLGECKYLQGNYRAHKRTKYVDDLLYETGLGRGYVKCISLEEDDKLTMLKSAINDLLKAIRFELKEVQE